MEALIKFQMISPSVTYGRCTDSWRWNSLEYRPPIATAVVPVAMVIQNGPSTDLRYRCLMSCHPRCSHNSRRRYPSTRSFRARANVFDCAAASTTVTTTPPVFRTVRVVPAGAAAATPADPSDHGGTPGKTSRTATTPGPAACADPAGPAGSRDCGRERTAWGGHRE